MKINVGVFFGGRSVEHEVSVISAMQAIAALDPSKYDVTAIYVAKDGRMFVGEQLSHIESYRDIKGTLEKAIPVIAAADGDRARLLRYPQKRFGDNTVATLDVAIPVFHGTGGEDGAFQGFLEQLNIPYGFCDVCASAIGMDKWAMKSLFQASGVPCLPGVLTRKASFYASPEAAIARIESALSYPIIVKPYNLGSSVGIGFARDRAQLDTALSDALSYSGAVLCERAITSLREINCAVLGDSEGARASCCEEPLGGNDFLTYSDKYQSGGKGKSKAPAKSAGMQSLARKIPADLGDKLTQRVQELAIMAFHAIDASGVSRVDFLMDNDSGELYVNEINTIPGSLSFYLWEPLGLNFTQLMDEIVLLALRRFRRNANLKRSFDSNILATADLSGAKR